MAWESGQGIDNLIAVNRRTTARICIANTVEIDIDGVHAVRLLSLEFA